MPSIFLGNERHWSRLTDSILNGDVIPVIGPEFLAADTSSDHSGKWMNPHMEIIQYLKKEFDITDNVKSFSELMWHRKFPLELKRAIHDNYSDWLCRFVWFSLKSELNKDPKGMLVDSNGDDSLMQFMHRLDTFTQERPEEVINELERRIIVQRKRQEKDKFHTVPLEDTDVFISYSRRDGKVADKLYELLTQRKLRVWYDKENLGGGDDFMKEIYKSIQKTRLFIPILTDNISKEVNDEHPYRKEWKKGIEKSQGFGRNFLWPIYERGFDFYSSEIPEEMGAKNAREFKDQDDLDKICDEIYNFLMTIS